MSDILPNQCTIKKEVTLKGVGLHTGKNVTLTFKPAPVNTGYVFKRIDMEGAPCIAADANYVTNTQRGTNLEKDGVIIQTSEHPDIRTSKHRTSKHAHMGREGSAVELALLTKHPLKHAGQR